MDSAQDVQAPDALIKMANQIACNIAPGKTQKEAANAMAEHLIRFWARSMKKQIIDCLDIKNNQLTPLSVEAIILMKKIQKQPTIQK